MLAEFPEVEEAEHRPSLFGRGGGKTLCRLRNWWHPESGGADYIYSSLVGQRRWQYKRWDHRLSPLQGEITQASEQKDRQMAIGGLMDFAELKGTEHAGQLSKRNFY